MKRFKNFLQKHRVVAWIACLVASPVLAVAVVTVVIVGTVVLLLAKAVDFIVEKVGRPLTLDEVLAGKGGKVVAVAFLESEEFWKCLAQKNLETSIARFQQHQNSPSVYVRDYVEGELARDLRVANTVGLKWQKINGGFRNEA